MQLNHLRANSRGDCDVVVRFLNEISPQSVMSLAKRASCLITPVPSLEMAFTASVEDPVWLDAITVALTIEHKKIASFVNIFDVQEIYENTIFQVPHAPEIGPAAAVENEANWGIDYLRIPELIKAGCDEGANIKVGVLDSGVTPLHPCFANGQIKGYAAFDLRGEQIAGEQPRDSMWHGTHVCGILAGANDGFARGVAPKSEVYVGRVLEGWNGSVASIKAGLIWMRDVVKPNVLNLSLGWPGLHPEWYSELRDLVEAGTIVCAASGNEFPSPDRHRSPANYPLKGVISIGAINQAAEVWEYSGGGAAVWPEDSPMGENEAFLPAIVAPGVDIVSSAPPAGGAYPYRRESGTSMATPFISGLLALLISHPKIDSDLALTILLGSLVDGGAPGVDDRYGGGYLDSSLVVSAVRAL